MSGALQFHSVLVYQGKALGVRLFQGGAFYDVALEDLKGVTSSHLKGMRWQKLIEHGDLLVTEDELKGNIVVKDFTQVPNYVHLAVSAIDTAIRGKSAQETKSKRQNTGKSAVFEVVVEVETLYNPVTRKFDKQQLTGEFEARNALMARKIAKEWYAQELGTVPNEVKVISCLIKK